METAPGSFIMPRNRHKQGIFEWQGMKIKVDDGIQPLLLILNRFDRIATTASCVGGKRGKWETEEGYAAFTGNQPKDVKSLCEWLSQKLPQHLNVRVEYNESRDTAGFAWGCLRWNPAEFDVLVETLEVMQKAGTR